MTPTQTPPTSSPRLAGQGFLFGIPVGDLGWFASLIMGTALGFAAFFAATFLAIITLLIYNTATHHLIDYSFAYKRVGLPFGLLVLVVAYVYLAILWARRVLRRN